MADTAPPPAEHADELPEDLDVSAYVGPYTFPDIDRRRIPAAIYLAAAVALFLLWLTSARGGVLVNRGFLGAAIALAVVGLYHLRAGWHLEVRETDALAAASRQVGFPIGHASAQLGWRGLLSRPTWRILLYSTENPPLTRGLVLVDGVDGAVVEFFTEANPEDWSKL